MNAAKTAFLCATVLAVAAPAYAADGQTIVSHAKALAGNVTPGDAPGYPVTLSRQGSYRLSSNLTAPAGLNAIEATNVDITIDLNGFRIEGANVGNVGIRGTQRNLTVRNGTIQRFNFGISTGGVAPLIEDMRISENSSVGILIESGQATIRNTSVVFNRTAVGIFCTLATCMIEGGMIAQNRKGIVLQFGAVHRTVIADNGTGVEFSPPSKVGGSYTSLLFNTIQNSSNDWISTDPNACSPAC